MVWPNTNPGSDNRRAIANHPCIRGPKGFKPLKPDRRPNADLIILPAEEILVADVLAVQVICPGGQPPGNQYINRRFDKPVVVIPCRIHVPVSGEIIRVFIAATQAEVNTVK